MSVGGSDTPLGGVRVLEIGQIVSAPYAGLLLADLGAEVIKIEPPRTGDAARNPEVSGYGGKSATFLTLNRNKRSVCLDLADEQDYALFQELVTGADVVVTNMLPGTAERLRVDSPTLRRLNPALVTCRILGFRGGHPRMDEPSFDLIHQALAGYLTIGGHPDTDPARIAIPLADLAAAMFSVYGILAALVSRERTGRGDDVEVPMYDSLLSLLTYQATLFLNSGEIPERLGSAHPHTAPWQSFAAADGSFVIAVRNQKFWQRLCAAIDRPSLASDARFATNHQRLAHRTELQQELEKVFATAPAGVWVDRLRAGGVPVAPVQGMADALTAEVESGSPLIQQFNDPSLGPVKLVGNPVRFTRMSLASPLPAPELDEAADELLPGRGPHT